MTEKEKMIIGQMYNPMDQELFSDRIKAKKLCQHYNNIPVDDFSKREDYLKTLFRTENKPYIEPNFWCDYGYNISFGSNFYANHNLTILDVCPVIFGSDVMVGPNVGIYTATHPLNAEERLSGKEFGKPITIGDKVWIGANAVILPGVTIGNESIIAAGSVVTKSFGDHVVVGGNPAKIIKQI